MRHWTLFPAPSDSDCISASLTVHILTLTSLLPLTTKVLVLYHPAGLSGSKWELLLWSCLMPPAQIRTGDPVTWILNWIAQSCPWITMNSAPIYYNLIHRLIWTQKFLVNCHYHVVFCTSDIYWTFVSPKKKDPFSVGLPEVSYFPCLGFFFSFFLTWLDNIWVF